MVKTLSYKKIKVEVKKKIKLLFNFFEKVVLYTYKKSKQLLQFLKRIAILIYKKIKHLLTSIKKISISVYKKIKLRILLKIYILKEKIQKIKENIKFHSRAILRWSLFLCSVCIAIIVYLYLSKHSVDNSSLSNWFVALGGIIGTIIAIVFSLINFLQQSAETLQSSSFYENYLHSRKDKLIFGFLVLTVLQLLSSSLFTAVKSSPIEFSNILASIDIIFTCLSIILIDALHESASKKINPINAIDYIKTESIKELDNIDNKARSLVNILSSSTDLPQKEIESLIYGEIEKDSFLKFSELLTSLIEIARQLESQNKQIAARKAIDAITEILSHYLRIRSGNSTIGMASEVLLAFESDSESFMMNFLEEMNRFESFLIENNDEPSAVKIVKMYESLITIAFGIKYTNGDLLQSNPIAQQLIGYFKDQLQRSIKLNNRECIFQSTNVLNNLMIISSKQDDQIIIPLLLDILDIAMYWGYANQEQIIIERGIKALIYSNNSLLYADYFKYEMHSEEILKNLFKNIKLIQRIDSYSLYDLILIQIFTYWLPDTINRAFQQSISQNKVDISNIFKFLESFAYEIRAYAKDTLPTDLSLFFSIGGYLTSLNQMIYALKENVQDDRTVKKLENLLIEYIQLVPWFIGDKEDFELENYRTLFNAPAIIGIQELEKQEPNTTLINSVVESLKNSLNKVLKSKKSYGYDEPRAALFLSYIGILALKKDNMEIFNDIKNYLKKYSEDYNEKYKEEIEHITSLNNMMIVSELWKWRDDLINTRARTLIHDDLITLISTLIKEEDIDRFIFAVWNVCDDRCSLREEHQAIIDQG